MPKKKQSTLDAFRNFDKHTQRATQLATSPTKSAQAATQATQAAATHAKKVIGAVCTSAFLSVLQHVIQLQAEPLLIKRLCKRTPDPVASAARIMANTSGIVGLLGLVVNQFGGKLSDALGRKQFWYVGPFTSIVTGLIVRSFSNNLTIVAACRCLRLVATTFSSSVMTGAVLSDVASGKILAAAGAKIGAYVGAAIVVAPILEGILLKYTKQSLTAPALGLAVIGAVHIAYLSKYMPETNTSVLKYGQKKVELSVNPLKFVSLYYSQEDVQLNRLVEKIRTKQSTEIILTSSGSKYKKDIIALGAVSENKKILQKMVTINTMQSFLEGKNVTDLVQIWQREHLNWDVFQMRDFTVAYGILCVGTGVFLTPWLLKYNSPRNFTTFTNFTNALGFVLRKYRVA